METLDKIFLIITPLLSIALMVSLLVAALSGKIEYATYFGVLYLINKIKL